MLKDNIVSKTPVTITVIITGSPDLILYSVLHHSAAGLGDAEIN